MEELIILPITVVAIPLAYFLADVVGLCLGLGWRHFSKKRKQKKIEAEHQGKTFE